MGTFWCTLCFLTINPLETPCSFCWKLCNADFNVQHCPNSREAKHVMPNDFEMIKWVRANRVAQTTFFRIVFKIFRKIACGFSSSNQYSQDVDAKRKSIGFFGLVNFVASAKVYMKQLAFLDGRGVLFAIDDDVKILAPPAVIGKIVEVFAEVAWAEAGLATQTVTDKIFVQPSAREVWRHFLEPTPRNPSLPLQIQCTPDESSVLDASDPD